MTGSRRLLAFLAVLALTPTAAAPQSQNDALRQSGAQTFQFQLGNGMQVLVIPDHRAPVATQMLWFKVGGVDDPAGISGMAHFFEHNDVPRHPQGAGRGFHPRRIAKNGGESNAFTTHDYTAYYEQIAKDRLQPGDAAGGRPPGQSRSVRRQCRHRARGS